MDSHHGLPAFPARGLAVMTLGNPVALLLDPPLDGSTLPKELSVIPMDMRFRDKIT
jgi:hypothetical protein